MVHVHVLASFRRPGQAVENSFSGSHFEGPLDDGDLKNCRDGLIAPGSEKSHTVGPSRLHHQMRHVQSD